MPIKLFLEWVKLNDNSKIEFEEGSITVIVGPNNSGKSTFLNEIYQQINNGKNFKDKIVTDDISVGKDGGPDDLKVFLSQVTQKSNRSGEEMLLGYQIQFRETDALVHWGREINVSGLGVLHQIFCFLANTSGRLDICNPPSPVNFITESPTHPIHILKLHQDIEQKFSGYCKKAFGKDLIVNHGAGNIIPLHLGTAPTFDEAKKEHPVSESYLKKLQALPTLERQGDGIKSFVGCLLATLAVKRFVTLIDEPEAFLHPPQARLIGKMLGNEHKDGQFIIATHSIDVLKGLLESQTQKLNIVRLLRSDKKNHFQKLSAQEIRDHWADPVLRFSNVLDGIFHEGVIICEDDSDCRFYGALINALSEQAEGISDRKVPDNLLLPSGGISRIHKIVKSLTKLGVLTQVIADFDLLSNQAELERIYSTLGGDWAEIKPKYDQLTNSFFQKIWTPPKAELIQKVEMEIEKIKNGPEANFTEANQNSIKELIRDKSPKSEAKKKGKSVFKNEDLKILNELLRKLNEKKLWIVPIGELESFAPSVTGKGVVWVANVLQKDILNDEELKSAREFVRQIIQI